MRGVPVTLQRLILTFKPEEITMHALYRTKHGPNPGTKTRTREVTELARAGLTQALETLIRSLIVQSRELSERWSEMGAGDQALAFGLLFDRSMRMLELHEGAGGRGVRS